MLNQGFTICLSSLELLEPDEQGVVTSFRNLNETTIQKVIAMGIKLGSIVSLQQRYPSFIIKLDNTSIAVDKEIVRAIVVRINE
ncbi:ferrous iron transport protein A [Phormidium sp. LEGE 05292]|uniref:FeoA family protein n=1 Tax=[Phormidium] sp. LEGE 05292 TaxID=767427 RepID=UPI00187FB690|nr:FeoA family protein [Phormidium sp. LEGE 05292]MBE9228856.1 ferrous iron transport protein A [Phormidium sp. LEGE 05292]